jgi:RNA polymerase sigma factor (sigma-70 family)
MDAIEVTTPSVTPGHAPTLEEGATLPVLAPVSESSASGMFEAIYEEHFRSIYRYALLATRRPADAEDVVADTFARALVAWRSGHGPSGRPLPWLLVICRRLVTDRWRRRRLIGWFSLTGRGASGGADEDAADLDPAADDDALNTREFWLWLEALTRALPARQREVLFLRYERDLTDDEIGQVLGLTASGVRSLTARAIASLRRHPELLT